MRGFFLMLAIALHLHLGVLLSLGHATGFTHGVATDGGDMMGAIPSSPGQQLKTDGDKIACRWTVNNHGHTSLHGQLSPALRGGISAKTTSLHPAGNVGLSGFIDYPTELFVPVPPPQPAARPSATTRAPTKARTAMWRRRLSRTAEAHVRRQRSASLLYTSGTTHSRPTTAG